ncbi:hypothetical protein JM946_11250 [Steroidobacter sp. S1-65]|uniref:Alginate export domain-containing protein n=1 Tax=Steroidobacter gossypii TaxID=2805490 RepID=A0ABS1WWH5_9GAMM|nr:hypothetical protein [Steroidobacter gossypii]MBM0105331.1 hypothetical protein [Steroidobacter gossypii]
MRKRRRPLTTSLLTLSTFVVTATAWSTTASAQEVCYQDDVGRIVKRRRPGYTEVPCPQEGAAPQAPIPSEGVPPPETQQVVPVPTPQRVVPLPPREAQPDVPASVEDTGRAPRRRTIERAPPASISPIPRPGLADFVDSVPMPDRWRIVDTLGYKERWWDPYNRNVLKADKPVVGEDWFFNLGLISDTVYELREVPTPVGAISTDQPGGIDVFGSFDQWSMSQNVSAELVYYKGNTVFKPPDWEFRVTPVFSYNYTELEEVQGVNADARRGLDRDDTFVGLQAAFVDRHIRNVSDNYDFDSFRIGIQPFSSDFRGFLFQDNQLGARLFGTRDNNKWQYNIAYFRRLEKDTNSGLNDVGETPREDDVFVVNLYRQDFPVLGFTSQATVLHNRNRDDEIFYNANGFIERPSSLGLENLREYDVTYVGYNGDGHFGRLNLTTSVYYAFGDETPSVFVNQEVDISAVFAAAELSVDFDWIRPRLSLLYGSGDDNPFDDEANGFDAVFENPQFAGADTSYFIRQAVPLIGGGRVALATRNGVLNNLRSSKEQGQSNFTNPGVLLAGLGVDMDLMPTLRVSLNANSLYFDDTAVLEVARNQGPIDKHIGYDVSASLIYRPLMSQNIVVRASYATLIAGDGFDALFPDEDPGYFLLNAIFAY